MAKKNIVSPDREQPTMAKNMQTDDQKRHEELSDHVDAVKKQASQEYAPYFKEMNWLKAISPNLEFKPFGNQKEVS
jgi:hypothetical protein